MVATPKRYATRAVTLARFLVIAGALTACGAEVKPMDKSSLFTEPGINSATLKTMGESSGFNLFGKSNKNDADNSSTLGVNPYLWRGTLDTLSFMPLASADPFGGVIITDWYSPPSATAERFKATAYILGRQLRADGVRISIFRQVQQNGRWVDAPVATSTTGEIENKVLMRARELRAQSASAQ